MTRNLQKNDKLSAVEILGQKGHGTLTAIFSRALESKDLSPEIKGKIIETICGSEKYDQLSHLLAHLLLHEDNVTSQKVEKILEKVPKKVLKYLIVHLIKNK